MATFSELIILGNHSIYFITLTLHWQVKSNCTFKKISYLTFFLTIKSALKKIFAKKICFLLSSAKEKERKKIFVMTVHKQHNRVFRRSSHANSPCIQILINMITFQFMNIIGQ